jgi:ABC-type multidrug transport system fused ATPase/permease subunit
MIKYLSKVWYILKGSRKKLPFIITVFIATSVLEALGIGAIGPFLALASNPDDVLNIKVLEWLYSHLNLSSTDDFIPILGLIIAAVFLVKSIFYFVGKFYVARFSFNQQAQLSSRLLKSYLIAPYTFHLKKNSAAIINNIIGETQYFNYGAMQPLLTSLGNFIVLILLFVLLAGTDLTLLVIISIILLATFISFFQLRNFYKRWGKEVSQATEASIRVIRHSLGGLKETRIIGCEDYFENQINHEVGIIADRGTKSTAFRDLPRIVIETVLVIFILAFVCLARIFLDQDMEEITSTMAIFGLAGIRLIPAASNLISSMGILQNRSYAVDQLYHDLKELEDEGVKLNTLIPNRLQQQRNTASNGSLANQKPTSMNFTKEVELQSLDYSYPGSVDLALQEVSLTFKKGESIAFIGKSGAGKTTLVDVILGLLKPVRGDIQVDGVSIYDDLKAWKNLVGYIPQSIFLMDDTIQRNIAFGVPDELIDQDKMKLSVTTACLDELIDDLPDGLNTVIGEAGTRLSGGQRQRIGIARALYHEREILVLDEATSALDNETEKYVSEAINALAGNKTLIMIAHRLTTVENCDRIYLMEHGQIIKSGSYEEVVVE